MNFFNEIRGLFTGHAPSQPDAPAPALSAAGSRELSKMEMAALRQKYMKDVDGATLRVSPNTFIYLENIIGGDPIDDKIPATITVDDARSGRKTMTRKGIWSYNLLDEMVTYDGDRVCAPARLERTVTISIRTSRSVLIFIIMPDEGINTGDVFMSFRISIAIITNGENIQTSDKYVLFEKNPEDGRFDALDNALLPDNDTRHAQSIDNARNLMAEGKHYLALPELKAAYQWIKAGLLRHEEPDSSKARLADIANMLGTCYGARNLWDAALFYRVLDTNLRPDNAPVQGALDEAMIKARDIRALATYSSDFLASNAALDVPQYQVTPLGSVLELCLDIAPSDLTAMTCRFDSPSVPPLEIQPGDIADFDFRSCAARLGSFTAVAARGHIGQNVVALRVEREKGCVRLAIITPDFISTPTEHYPLAIQLLYSATPYISRADFDELRARLDEKKSDPDATLSAMEREMTVNDADAAYHLFCARVALDKKIWGDALYHFLKAYRRLAAKEIVGQAEEITRSIVIDLNYRLGFVLEELKCHWMAASFLERNVPANNITYHTEFLNALANDNDLRALSVLDMFRRLISEGKYNAPARALRDFSLFLDRRYAYILIEAGEVDSARSYLQSLLDNPESDAETRNFAKNELEYIESKLNNATPPPAAPETPPSPAPETPEAPSRRKSYLQVILFIIAAVIIWGILSLFVKGDKIVVTNDSDIDRIAEIVEVELPEILKDSDKIFNLTDADGNVLPYQRLSNGNLVFPATVAAHSSAKYTLKVDKDGVQVATDTLLAYTYQPLTQDDLAWENVHSGYRLYGPSYRRDGGNVHGYDIWCKRGPMPVVESFYRQSREPMNLSYHTDRGKGFDGFAVGPTLGAGGCALMLGDSLVYTTAYRNYRIVDNGPLRLTIEFDIDTVMYGNTPVAERRTVTLDRDAYFNRVSSEFRGIDKPVPVAAGIVVHCDNPAGTATDSEGRFVCVTDLTDKPTAGNGEIYIGLFMDGAVEYGYVPLDSPVANACGHMLMKSEAKPGEPFVYYFGSGWSKHSVKDEQEWLNITRQSAEAMLHPLKVKLSH